MPSARLSDLSLACLLSHCLSALENQEPGALGTHRFGNCPSLNSTHPGQTLLATRPGEEGRSDAFLCLPVSP